MGATLGAAVTETLVAPKPFRIVDMVIGFVGAIVLANIGMGVAMKSDGSHFAVFAAGMSGLWLGLLVSVRFAARRSTVAMSSAFAITFRKGDVLRGLAIGVVCQLVPVQLIYLALQLFFDPGDVADRFIEMYGQGWHIYPLLFGLVLVTPVIEELFYRGQVLRTISQWLPPRYAALISALLFAAMHFNPLSMLGLFCFGIVLAEAVHRTGRLGFSIFAHIGFNAAAFALVLL